MKKIATFILLLVASCGVAVAQDSLKIKFLDGIPICDSIIHANLGADGKIDFAVFGRQARNDSIFQNLMERFNKCDTTLQIPEICVLYYGFAFRDEYNGGYEIPPWHDLVDKKYYKKAYKLVCESIKIQPASADYLRNALDIAREVGRPKEEIDNLEWRLYRLMTAIYFMGDGSAEHPWPVISVGDEYAFLYRFLRVKRKIGHQSLIVSMSGALCDKMEIEPLDNDYFRGNKIWFDVTLPFPMMASPQHWAKKLTND